jgi:ribonucleoside-diphosphate reductase alpha chain
MAVGSAAIRRHVDKIKEAVRISIHKNGYIEFNVEKNELLRDALTDALEDNVPENYLYQILYCIKELKELPDPPQYTVEWEDESYNTVSGQASNNSIRVTDTFMNAVANDEEWNLVARTTGEAVKTVKAKDL